MHLGRLLYRIAEQGVSLRCGRTEDRLNNSPAGALSPELVAELKACRREVIQILREDEEYRKTGIIQCERQVFDLAQSYSGEDGKA